ncbi:hypothetical protein GVAV_000355 [Gurleya vavrai]
MHRTYYKHETEKKFVYKVNYKNIKYNESEPFGVLFDMGIKKLKPVGIIYILGEKELVLYQFIPSDDKRGNFWYIMFPKEEFFFISFLRNYDDLIEQTKKPLLNLLKNSNFKNCQIVTNFFNNTIDTFFTSLKPYQIFLTLLKIKKNAVNNIFLFHFIESAFQDEKIVILLEIRNYKQRFELIIKNLFEKNINFFNHSIIKFKELLDTETKFDIYFKQADKILIELLENLYMNFTNVLKINDLKSTCHISIKNL